MMMTADKDMEDFLRQIRLGTTAEQDERIIGDALAAIDQSAVEDESKSLPTSTDNVATSTGQPAPFPWRTPLRSLRRHWRLSTAVAGVLVLLSVLPLALRQTPVADSGPAPEVAVVTESPVSPEPATSGTEGAGTMHGAVPLAGARNNTHGLKARAVLPKASTVPKARDLALAIRPLSSTAAAAPAGTSGNLGTRAADSGNTSLAKAEQNLMGLGTTSSHARSTRARGRGFRDSDARPALAASYDRPAPDKAKIEAEAKKIAAMAAGRDIDGLVKMLSVAEFDNKVAAADHLAAIGDQRALVDLEKLNRSNGNWWIGGEPAMFVEDRGSSGAFAWAIWSILHRDLPKAKQIEGLFSLLEGKGPAVPEDVAERTAHFNFDVGRRVGRQLEKYDDPAIVARLRRTKNKGAAISAVKMEVRRMDKPAAMARCLQIARNEDGAGRYGAIGVLGTFGSDAFGDLDGLARQGHSQAIIVLGYHKQRNPKALELICWHLTNNSTYMVRLVAVQQLWTVTDRPGVVPALIEALYDPEESIRRSAASLLSITAYRNTSADRAEIENAMFIARSHPDKEVRKHAVKALKKLDSKRLEEPLTKPRAIRKTIFQPQPKPDKRRGLDEQDKAIPTTQRGVKAAPAKPEDKAPPREAPWGKAVEGVQVRLRAKQSKWKQGTVPRLLADVRNQGKRNLLVRTRDHGRELEVDGRWYCLPIHAGTIGPPRTLPPGRRYDDIAIDLHGSWLFAVPRNARAPWKAGPEKLGKLTPGRHTVRVAFTVTVAKDAPGKPFKAVSNPVEIKILPSTPKPKTRGTDADDEDAVAALLKLGSAGAELTYDDQGRIIRIWFCRTWVTDVELAHLKGLGKLESLTILLRAKTNPPRQDKMTGADLVHLAGLSNLKRLSLYIKVSDDELAHLKGLTNLERLSISGAPVTGTGFAHLKRLTKLSDLRLRGRQITDAGLEHIKGIPNLKTVDLIKTRITSEGLRKLQEALPNVRVTSDIKPDAPAPPDRSVRASGKVLGAGAKPPAGEAAWGEAVDGVQVRLWGGAPSWKVGEAPTFKVDVRNGAKKTLFDTDGRPDIFNLEFDGHWYISSVRVRKAKRVQVLPGQQHEDLGILPLSQEHWWGTVPPRTPGLTAGKHTVRVAFVGMLGAGSEADGGKPVRAVSNAVEITILPSTPKAKTPDVAPDDQNAVAALRRLGSEGARLTFDDQGWVTYVWLSPTRAAGPELALLKGLPKFEWLVIEGLALANPPEQTKMAEADFAHLKALKNLKRLSLPVKLTTDAGLVHLKGLAKLENLSLMFTQVTDAGLAHLKGLAGLKELDLSHTKISDAGLVHLREMTNLRSVTLTDTRVTDDGLKKLHEALPKAKLFRNGLVFEAAPKSDENVDATPQGNPGATAAKPTVKAAAATGGAKPADRTMPARPAGNPTLDGKEILKKLKSIDAVYAAAFTASGKRCGGPIRKWKFAMLRGRIALEEEVVEITKADIAKRIRLGRPRVRDEDPMLALRSTFFVGPAAQAKYDWVGTITRYGPQDPWPEKSPGPTTAGSLDVVAPDDPTYMLPIKRTLWCLGRGYSRHITEIRDVSRQKDGRLIVAADGLDRALRPGAKWELVIDPNAEYLVRSATLVDNRNRRSSFTNSGLKQHGSHCVPEKGECKGAFISTSLEFQSASFEADVKFLKRAKATMQPPYLIDTDINDQRRSPERHMSYDAGKMSPKGGRPDFDLGWEKEAVFDMKEIVPASEPKLRDVIGGSFTPAFARKGEIEIRTREYTALLVPIGTTTSRFDRPETVLLLISADNPGHRIQSYEKHLGSIRTVEGKYYRISATPTGDKLTVTPCGDNVGVLEIGAGGRDIEPPEVSGGGLVSKQGSVPLGNFYDPVPAEDAARRRVPVGDYAAADLTISFGKVLVSVQPNGPPVFDLKIRKDKPVKLNFAARGKIVLRAPKQSQTFKRGNRVMLDAVIVDPELNLQVSAWDTTKKGETRTYTYGLGKKATAMSSSLPINPTFVIRNSSGKEVATGKLPFC